MVSRSLRVAPLFFFSGFCALIYQMEWLREFRLFFGASTAATAAVLAIFMSGLGFGSVILGQRSEAKERPLEFYAKLELFISATAAVSPLLLMVMRHIYLSLGGTLAMGLSVGTVVRLVMSALVIGLPTFLMGGTLPAVARAVVDPDDTNRRPVALLYGANTLGAMTGVTIATFYLFETLGNRLTLTLAAMLNIGVALAAFSMSKTLPITKPGTQKPLLEEASAPALFVYLASAVAGFGFLLMEIVWYRMLGSLLGGSTFTFGLILAVALFGIGLGGLIYAIWFGGRPITLSGFAFVSALEAFCVAAPYALGDRVALIAMLLRQLGVLGFDGFVAGWTMVCAIVVLPAAIISGIQFPMLIALLGKGRTQVGAQTGMAYAWNTVGAIAGSLAGGFGFLPAFSAPGVWRLVIVLLGGLVATATIIDLRRRFSIWRLLPALTAVVVALALLETRGPTTFWRHSEIGVGRLAKFTGSKTEFHDLMNTIRREILWDTDGVESSVALSTRNNLNFIVNGKCDGGLKLDAGTQIMSGLILAALHPHPKRALVVGLGTGSTAGWLAAVPSIERVDVCELEPAILRVARQCTPMNHAALANPKLHVILGDAREMLMVGRDKYDLIISEPSNPYRAGIASLFTREYYETVARRLNPGGLFAQWMQAYEIDDRTIQTVYSTLGSVFPNIETWQTENGDLLLIGTDGPRNYDANELRRRIAEEPFQTALRHIWGIINLEGFLAHFIADASVAKRLQDPHARLNTDDRTVLEFAFARNVDLQNGFSISSFRLMGARTGSNRLSISSGDVSWPDVDLARMSMLLGSGETPNPTEYPYEMSQNRVAAYAAYMKNDLTNALSLWRKYPREPGDLNELLMVAECTASEGDPEADAYIEKLRQSLPAEADMVLVRLLLRRGKLEEATGLVEKILQRFHTDPWIKNDLMERTLLLTQLIVERTANDLPVLRIYEELRNPFIIYNRDNSRRIVLLRCGIKLDKGQFGKYCLPVIEALEPYVPWDAAFLQSRAACYQAIKHSRLAQAERDLREFMAEQPSHLEVVVPASSASPQGNGPMASTSSR
ncbi:MAG: fused MFS/spermidine synthase [Chthoniobacterales bacterium]